MALRATAFERALDIARNASRQTLVLVGVRLKKRGDVYIAGSLDSQFIKVGVASDIAQRERQLRAERYGGSSDWMVLVYHRVNDMQRVEREIASRIAGERVFNGYIKDGREQVATEIIRCPFSAALDAYAAVTGLVQDKASLQQQWVDYELKTELGHHPVKDGGTTSVLHGFFKIQELPDFSLLQSWVCPVHHWRDAEALDLIVQKLTCIEM